VNYENVFELMFGGISWINGDGTPGFYWCCCEGWNLQLWCFIVKVLVTCFRTMMGLNWLCPY